MAIYGWRGLIEGGGWCWAIYNAAGCGLSTQNISKLDIKTGIFVCRPSYIYDDLMENGWFCAWGSVVGL